MDKTSTENAANDKLVDCECCKNRVKSVDIKKFHSMSMCGDCYDKEIALQQENMRPENVAKRIEETRHPKKLEELYASVSADETVKIAELPWDTEPDKAYKFLQERILAIEQVQLEAKVRGTVLHKKKREYEASNGINRWDKDSKGLNKSNSSDPRTNRFMSDVQKEHKKALSKCETAVKGYLALGQEPEDIIELLTMNGKFKGSEIREAIQKFQE